jgi:hypothetical protein
MRSVVSLMKWKDWVVSLPWNLQTVRSKGIAFKNKLDQLNAKKCVAVMGAGAGEVATIRAPVHRKDL